MAELIIGEHCNVIDCKQLDFLPLACNLCEQLYCKQHASYDEHSCPGLAKLLAEHSTSSTPLENRAPLFFKCDFSSCSRRELVEIRCDSCGACHCLLHRHSSDHLCPSSVPSGEPLQKTSELIKELIEKSKSSISSTAKPKVFKDPKSIAMASKIALIKLKQKATGDSSIPDADRVFLDVLLPLGSQQKRLPMFFSRHWFIGKAIDKVASAARLTHSRCEAGLMRSLRMFDANAGLLCPSGLTLGDLLDNAAADCTVLYSGSTVIVEYTSDTTQQISTEPY